MRVTSIAIYGGLLVVALIAAYLTWTHEPPGGKGDVVVVDVAAGELQQVVYEEPDHRVTVARRATKLGDVCWGDTTKTKDAPKKGKDPADPFADRRPGAQDDADAAAGDDDSAGGDEAAEPEPEAAPPERITEVKTFRGNDTCDKILDRFAPMKALRAFDGLDEAKLAEMELVEPEAHVTVSTARGERVFDVGGRSYGTNDYYVRDRDSGQVLLVESRMVADIKGGSTRLMERQVHGAKKQDVERATVIAGQRTLQLVQQNRDDSKNAFWAEASDLTRVHDAGDAWIDKVMRLRALEYYRDPPAQLTPALRVEMAVEGGEAAWMEFGTAVDADGEPIHVARSSTTVAWVRVSDHMGTDVVEGLAELFPDDA